MEGKQVQHVLLRVARAYPQALYYPLRTYVTEGPQTGSAPEPWAPMPPPQSAAAPAAAAPAAAAPAAAAQAAVKSEAPATATAASAAAPATAAGAPAPAGGGAAPVAAAAADTADAGMLAVGVGGAAAPADAVPNAPAPAMAPVVDAPKTLVTTLGLRGPAALVLAEMMHEHPQLHMQLSSTWDAIVRHLGPSPTERLLHAIGELVNLCLAQPPCTNSVPSSVTQALAAIDAAFGLSGTEAAPMDTSSDADGGGAPASLPLALRSEVARALLGAPPSLLTELLATLSGVRARLEAELSSPTARLRSQRLETSCWPLAMLQQPLMEVPAQYACQERSPALDQHALVERFQAAVGVHLDRASGETTRIITLRADDGTSHSFALRRAPLRRPHAPLGHERMGQLARLLNARLLGAREARRRSLVVHVPACVRLGGGLSLVASGAVPRLSLTSALALSSALAGAQSDASQSSQSVHATALAHQRALARAPPAEEPRARQERLREAFQDAISATPEDALSRALYGCAPSAGVLWDLQRRITSQLGLHALLTHALQLSATLPETIVLRRDTGAVELLEFTSFGAGASPKDVVPIDEVPFRLTRTLQQFITPLGIDGPFSGAFCAAAECLANQNKCPLPQWLDALARREGGPSGGDPDDTASAALAQGLVPWGSSGLKAAERVQNLSPVLLARSAAGNRPMADVHAKVRSLIDAATNTDNLCAMPSGWMAWL